MQLQESSCLKENDSREVAYACAMLLVMCCSIENKVPVHLLVHFNFYYDYLHTLGSHVYLSIKLHNIPQFHSPT